MILPVTAQATGGVCMPCKKRQNAVTKAFVPEMSDTERAELEQKAIDLVRALKYRDIQSALEHFHPDERAKTEEMLRDDLDAMTKALPDEEPEFEWRKANSGLPILNITNSHTTWGMGWVCRFQDGKWWFS
jgi:hypothetical protein